MHKGVLPYVLTEFSKQDISEKSSKIHSYGLGLQFLPIPHVEIQAEFKKVANFNNSVQKSNNGWLVFHFYL